VTRHWTTSLCKPAQFFESLRYVVVDEVHTYRGVFGSHVANLIRRLKRICAFYGVTPQFILCSATIGNPKEHAEALIEDAVAAVTESGAPTGDKHVLLWNPPVVNPDLGLRASARSQTNRIARLAIKSGMKTLVFAQSRTMVEVLTKYLKDVFDHDPRKPARIRAYRGGYLPKERRAAEREMRAGTIDGISAPPRWNWAWTSAASMSWCSTAIPVRSPARGSALVVQAVVSSHRWVCWWPAPIHSTNISCVTRSSSKARHRSTHASSRTNP
jgi:ATP-dependent helicase YprA (DUF1998 family)